MRLETLTLIAAGMVVAACEPTAPGAAPPAESPAPASPRVAEPSPETPYRPMEMQPAESEQARQAVVEAQRDLDRRAATMREDVAAMGRQADEAYRGAQARSPEPASPQRTPP